MTEPTGYTAVGMVGFTDQGTYSSSFNYVKNDLAHYGGNIWCCLIDDTTGITPTEGTNWTLFVGEPTNMAERIIAPLEVSPSENAYSVGEQLIFNDVLYKAKTAIAVGDALVVDTNIELAPKVTSQIQTLTNETSDIVNVFGAKNLLPNTATSQVVNGVTFTVNSDGSVTANGTATDIATLALDTRYTIENGNYILSGCPNGGDSSHYEIQLINGDGTGIGNVRNYEGDTEFEASASITYRAQIVIRSGQTVSNLVFRPMIRPSSIVDSTYVPYAMTNRELTENDAIKHTVLSSSHTFRYGVDDVYKSGHVVFISANIQITSAVAAYTDIATIPSGYLPLQPVYTMDTAKKAGIQASTAGKIQCDTALAVNDVIAFTIIYLSE